MIQKALSYTEQALSQFLKSQLGLSENPVILNNVVNQDGSRPSVNKNKVVISLLHVEVDADRNFQARNTRSTDGNFSTKNQSNSYDLDILISANFDGYAESLRYLDYCILYFKSNSSINPRNSPSLDSDVAKINFELENLDTLQMHSLWASLGAKYVPSLVYKLRFITTNSD